MTTLDYCKNILGIVQKLFVQQGADIQVLNGLTTSLAQIQKEQAVQASTLANIQTAQAKQDALLDAIQASVADQDNTATAFKLTLAADPPPKPVEVTQGPARS